MNAAQSAEEQVIGSEEDAEETHDEQGEDLEEEDVSRNLEKYDENGDDDDGLDSEYDNQMTVDEVLQRLWLLKI